MKTILCLTSRFLGRFILFHLEVKNQTKIRHFLKWKVLIRIREILKQINTYIYRIARSLRRIDIALLVYTFIGILLTNLGLYYIYFACSSLFPPSEQIFVYKVTGEELFPLWGFLLCVVPAIFASSVVFISLKKSDFPFRQILIVGGGLLSLILALTFIPQSIFIFAAYMVLSLNVALITSIKILRGTRIPSDFIPSKSGELLYLQLRHKRLLTLISQAFWAIITIVLSGVSIIIVNPLSQKMLDEGGLAWIFLQGQIILGMVLIAYYVAGIFLGVVFPLYLELLQIEESVQKAIFTTPSRD